MRNGRGVALILEFVQIVARYDIFLILNLIINSNTSCVSTDTDPLSANCANIEIVAQLIGLGIVIKQYYLSKLKGPII